MHAIGVASHIKVHEDKDSRGTSAARTAPEPQRSDIVKTFTMHINPSQSYYEHKTNIRLSPTHGPWPKAASAQTRREDRDFVFMALRDVVPKSMAGPGLCDWHTGAQLSEEPVSMRARAADARLWHIRERQARRSARERREGGAHGSDLTAITSLDALCGSTSEGQRQEQPPDLDNRAGADPAREAGPQAPPPRDPAWIRRRHVKLNALADGGKHSKIDKKITLGNRVSWKSVLNSQADKVKLPGPPTEPLDNERRHRGGLAFAKRE